MTGVPNPGRAEPNNVRTAEYFRMLEALPARIREAAEAAFALFLEDPAHPSLRVHRLRDHGRGRHREGSLSVSITARYRAIYFHNPETNNNVWYWIGSHSDYNNFVGEG